MGYFASFAKIFVGSYFGKGIDFNKLFLNPQINSRAFYVEILIFNLDFLEDVTNVFQLLGTTSIILPVFMI